MLATGSPREVQTHPAVIEAYLGTVDDVTSLRRPVAGAGLHPPFSHGDREKEQP